MSQPDPYSGPYVESGSVELDDGQYTEAMLEEWAAYHMGPAIHPNAHLVGRQVTLPSGGRLDLLFEYGDRGQWTLTVVELKSGKAGVDAVLQCLRYVQEIRSAGWRNVTVDGVVAAPDHSGDAYRLCKEMDSMGAMTITPRLTCTCDRLWGGWSPEREPPDASNIVRRTSLGEAEARPGTRWGGEKIRNVIAPLVDDAWLRSKVVKRRRALVPLHLTPTTVARRNGDHA